MSAPSWMRERGPDWGSTITLNQDHPTKSCAQTNRTETWENLIIIIITITSLCITIIIVNIQRSVSKRDYSHVQIHVNKIMTPYSHAHYWTRWLYSVQIVHHIQQIEMAVNMTEAPFKRLSNDSLSTLTNINTNTRSAKQTWFGLRKDNTICLQNWWSDREKVNELPW